MKNYTLRAKVFYTNGSIAEVQNKHYLELEVCFVNSDNYELSSKNLAIRSEKIIEKK